MSEPRHFILGAAGHVDHGKTALITALTGTNTDRLKEEQERGISIELGFAELDLGDGLTLGVVDMPGHERFVKQMVAGAGGVDLAFLLVAADEGVMPQTIEHLAILDSLGVRGGVVVIAKTDLVDDEMRELATEEARDLVAGTFLEGRPIVPVSAHRGEGIAELKDALRAEAAKLPARGAGEPFRLPVDRVFSMPGAGAVVTGTCWSGDVAVGDQLAIEPGGFKVRVREVQAHGRKVERGGSGQRLALALHGIKQDDIERGHQVLASGSAPVTRLCDLRVDLFAHYQGVLKNRQRLHVNHAGREVLGRIVLLDCEEMGGDGPRSALCQLYLEAPLVPRRGDRLVLRFYSPVTSIAGGVILDANPRRHRRFQDEILARLAVMETGDPQELFRQNLHAAGLQGMPLETASGHRDDPVAVVIGRRIYARALVEAESAAIGEIVRAYAERFPLRLGMPREEIRRRRKFKGTTPEWNALLQILADLGGWVLVADRIAVAAQGPPLAPELAAGVAARESALRACGLDWPGLAAFGESVRRAPPPPAGQGEEEYLRHLVDQGRAVQIAPDYLVHRDAVAALIAKLRRHFAGQRELAFAEFRELSGLSRKLGIPMLEHLDQTGRTSRTGDARVAGPSLQE
ncbi:MAG: selenocysteine-specific translation elongation factor [Candidatus Krumholzibacteria bacterium]|jgi:selenocysteine-specific elongation factor|nr:selenocysteine-specific translation elongation factor [Candidatus Krumholzibacteria bacterium]